MKKTEIFCDRCGRVITGCEKDEIHNLNISVSAVTNIEGEVKLGSKRKELCSMCWNDFNIQQSKYFSFEKDKPKKHLITLYNCLYDH